MVVKAMTDIIEAHIAKMIIGRDLSRIFFFDSAQHLSVKPVYNGLAELR